MRKKLNREPSHLMKAAMCAHFADLACDIVRERYESPMRCSHPDCIDGVNILDIVREAKCSLAVAFVVLDVDRTALPQTLEVEDIEPRTWGKPCLCHGQKRGRNPQGWETTLMLACWARGHLDNELFALEDRGEPYIETALEGLFYAFGFMRDSIDGAIFGFAERDYTPSVLAERLREITGHDLQPHGRAAKAEKAQGQHWASLSAAV